MPTSAVCRFGGTRGVWRSRLLTRKGKHGCLHACASRPARRWSHLMVSPAVARMDDRVRIQVTGLPPRQPVTLTSRLLEEDLTFIAHAHYTAREDGTLDLAVDASHGGNFQGCEPMGLFWSLSGEEGLQRGLRLRAKNVMEPHRMTLSVLPGHVTVTRGSQHDEKSVLVQTELERHYAWADVIRIPVTEGAIRGTLFVPQGGVGRHPAVLDLYGSGGGLQEYRAAMLASRGFTTLALAYVSYQDLPKQVQINLDYFLDAIEYLNCHDNVHADSLGVVGISIGADIALQLAILSDKIRAAVSIGGNDFRYLPEFTYQGKDLPHASIEASGIKFTDDGFVFKGCVQNATGPLEEVTYKVEEAKDTDYLLLHGIEDQGMDPRSMLRLTTRLIEHGRSNVSLHLYQGAGHLLEPPYVPFCYSSWHKVYGSYFVWGGEVRLHAKAQEDAWAQILSFFKDRLQPAQS